jgi:hypothetical protein
MQGTSSQQKRCDDVPLILWHPSTSPPIGLGALEDFFKSLQSQGKPELSEKHKKGEASPDLPKFDASPVPKDDAIVVYH